MHLQIQGRNLIIHRDNGQTLALPFQSLTDIRPGSNKLSDQILHLSGKTWMQRDFLYALASEIHRLFPNNNINWIETFVEVEQSAYSDTINDIEAPIDDVVTLPQDQEVFNRRSEIDADLAADINVVREGVIERLQRIGLIN